MPRPRTHSDLVHQKLEEILSPSMEINKNNNKAMSTQKLIRAEGRYWSQNTRVGILPLMLIGRLALGELLNFSELQFQDL